MFTPRNTFGMITGLFVFNLLINFLNSLDTHTEEVFASKLNMSQIIFVPKVFRVFLNAATFALIAVAENTYVHLVTVCTFVLI